MNSTRRSFLGGVAAASLPVGTTAAKPAHPSPSIDALLAKALPLEKARYHASALAEAMNELSPGGEFIARIDREACFALVFATSPDKIRKDGKGGEA